MHTLEYSNEKKKKKGQMYACIVCTASFVTLPILITLLLP